MWTDLPSVLSQCTRVTDGQMDGQTDRILIAIPRLHYMQRGKNRLRLSKVIVKNKMSRFLWFSVYMFDLRLVDISKLNFTKLLSKPIIASYINTAAI